MRHQADSVKQVIRAETQRSEQLIVTQLSWQSSKTREEVAQLRRDRNSGPPLWEKRRTLLQSLKYGTMNNRLNSINENHSETFQWILQGIRPWLDQTEQLSLDKSVKSHLHPDCSRVIDFPNVDWKCFPCWLESPEEKIYWVQGKPGSGKSTLMKFLVLECGERPPECTGLATTDRTVLSHFLWAQGDALQKNIDGILLNLVQQLFSKHEELLDAVIESTPRLALKLMHDDWVSQELESLVMTSFAKCEKPVLIFLDGLDEMIHPDENTRDTYDNLIKLVNKLASIEKVKLCVSSRLEPEFQRQLNKFPTLRLQDVTRQDMRSVAKFHLQPPVPDLDSDKAYQELIETVCAKADGVFLWLGIVVKNLRSGMLKGDSLSELKLRLQSLPKGLNLLYKNMWSRTNEDHVIYGAEAARYFNMVRDWSQFTMRQSAIEVFHLTMASNPSKANSLIQDTTALSPEEIKAECDAASKRIAIRTAGLLEVNADGRRVEFTHRSAAEFLENTPEGQEILSLDKTPCETRVLNLLTAFLADVYLQVMGLRKGKGYSQTTQHFVMNAIYVLWERGDIPEPAGFDFMMACKRLDETGLWRSSPFGQDAGVAIHTALDFYGLSASYGFLRVISRLTEDIPLSPLAKRYLFAAACKEPNVMDDGNYLGKGRIVAEILGKDSSIFDLENQDSGLPILFFAALNIHAGAKHWPTVPGVPMLPQLLDQYLEGPFSLEERITFTLRLETGDDDDLWSPNLHCIGAIEATYARQSSIWVTLETDLASMVRLCLEALITVNGEAATDEAKKTQQSLENLRATMPGRHMRVLAFGFPSSGTASEARQYVCNKDGKILAPAAIPDAKAVLVCIGDLRVHRPQDTNAEGGQLRHYLIPGLEECLRKVALGARVIEEDDLEKLKDLPLRNALLELMTKPPKPFAK